MPESTGKSLKMHLSLELKNKLPLLPKPFKSDCLVSQIIRCSVSLWMALRDLMVDLTTREWEMASRQLEGGTATNFIGGSREEGWHFLLLGWDGRTILLVQGNDGYWNLCPKDTTHGNGKVNVGKGNKCCDKKISTKRNNFEVQRK